MVYEKTGEKLAFGFAKASAPKKITLIVPDLFHNQTTISDNYDGSVSVGRIIMNTNYVHEHFLAEYLFAVMNTDGLLQAIKTKSAIVKDADRLFQIESLLCK